MKHLSLWIALSIALAGGHAFASPDAGDAGDAGFACPTTAPQTGAPCSTPKLSCEFGADAVGRCATLAVCSPLGTWKLTAPPSTCRSNPPQCPKTIATLDAGSACPLTGVDDVCVYPEGACACTPCAINDQTTSTQWRCSGAPATGCPVQRPLVGSACTPEGQHCYWDGCCYQVFVGSSEVCTNGLWQETANGACICPPSPPVCTNLPILPKPDGGGLQFDDASTPDDAASWSDDAFGVAPRGGCSCSIPSSDLSGSGGLVFVGVLGVTCWRRRRRKNESKAYF